MIDRFVWDGDQLLDEIRNLEDTTITSASRFAGVVGYLHGAGIGRAVGGDGFDAADPAARLARADAWDGARYRRPGRLCLGGDRELLAAGLAGGAGGPAS